MLEGNVKSTMPRQRYHGIILAVDCGGISFGNIHRWDCGTAITGAGSEWGSHTEGERWRFFSGEIGLRQDRAVELRRDNTGDDDHHEIAVRD